MNHNYENFSSPNMITAFISATFGIMNFSAVVLPVGDDSLFVIGLIRLLLGGILFCGAMINLLKGNAAGNLNLIYAVCFGLFSGSNLMITVLNRNMDVVIQPLIYGILQVMAGLFVGCLLPAMKNLPFYQWCANLCSVAGLFCFGFGDVFWDSSISYWGGWCFFIFTFLSLYTGLSAILANLPQGPSMEKVFYRHQRIPKE